MLLTKIAVTFAPRFLDTTDDVCQFEIQALLAINKEKWGEIKTKEKELHPKA